MKQNTDSNYNFLLIGTATDVGRIRKANEDSMAVFEIANMKVFVVCDGMGGHVGGQVASQTAITAIRDFLTNNILPDPREAIFKSIMAANEAVLNRTRQQPELTGMGSTCVMLVITSDGKAYYGHVGDSRIYIIANHKITQLTEDHSVVYEMFKAGVIKTREEMEQHPRKNEITNALGLQGMRPPTVCNSFIEPNSGNCFLLCSDGLTGMVVDEQIQRVISKHEIPIQQRAETLVRMANENGGVDNITVELIEFALSTDDISTSKEEKKKPWKSIVFILSAILVLGILSVWLWQGSNSKTDVEKKEDTITISTDILKLSPIISPIKKDTAINYNEKVSLIKGQKITVKIFDKDSILNNTVEIIDDKNFIQAESNGNCIDITLTNGAFRKDSIKIKCETKELKYIVTIPITIPVTIIEIPSESGNTRRNPSPSPAPNNKKQDDDKQDDDKRPETDKSPNINDDIKKNDTNKDKREGQQTGETTEI